MLFLNISGGIVPWIQSRLELQKGWTVLDRMVQIKDEIIDLVLK